MIKYNQILKYFNVYYDSDGCPQTTSYVEMDDIHDAILSNGVHLDNEVPFYIKRARDNAIKKVRDAVNRRSLLSKNLYTIDTKTFDSTSLDDYGFTNDEKELCIEKMSQIRVRNSKFNQRKHDKLLNSVKQKLLIHYVSATII